MPDVDDVRTELRSLANERSLSSRRAMLSELADALDGNDAHIWARVNLADAFPDDAVADPRAVAAIERAGMIELIRNLAILAPLLVTWSGIASASHAYGAFLSDKSLARSAREPFIQLWQQGFHGHAAWYVPTFTQVGVADIVAIGLVVALSYWLGVVRKQVDVTYAHDESRIRGRLNRAVTESSVILAAAALDSPSRFSEALTVAAEKLAEANASITKTATKVTKMMERAAEVLAAIDASADKLVATHDGYAAATSEVAGGLAAIGPRLDGAASGLRDLVGGQAELTTSVRGGLDGLRTAASELGAASQVHVGRAADLSSALAQERTAFASAEQALVDASRHLAAALPSITDADARVAGALTGAAASANDMAGAAREAKGVVASLGSSITGPLQSVHGRLEEVVRALDAVVGRLDSIEFPSPSSAHALVPADAAAAGRVAAPAVPAVKRRGTASRGRPSDPLAMVGWVFADLMLGLALVFLATQPGDPTAGRVIHHAVTTTTTTTTTVLPTTTTIRPAAPGVDRQYACFRVTADPVLLFQPGPARDAQVLQLQQQVETELSRLGLSQRRAGVVLSFGASPTPGPGRAIAQAFDDLVLPLMPKVFGGSASRAFWDGQAMPTGSIAVNVYPLTGPRLTPLPPPADC